jgi:hypothetical protein
MNWNGAFRVESNDFIPKLSPLVLVTEGKTCPMLWSFCLGLSTTVISQDEDAEGCSTLKTEAYSLFWKGEGHTSAKK